MLRIARARMEIEEDWGQGSGADGPSGERLNMEKFYILPAARTAKKWFILPTVERSQQVWRNLLGESGVSGCWQHG